MSGVDETPTVQVLAFVGLAHDAPDADFLGNRYKVMPVPKLPGAQTLYVTTQIADDLLLDAELMTDLPNMFSDMVAERVREILTGPEARAVIDDLRKAPDE